MTQRALPTLDHVGIRVADLDVSLRFYSAALAPLGVEPIARGDDGSTGFGRDRNDDFWVHPGGTGTPDHTHIAFSAPGDDAVDAFHAAAIAAGGRDNGPPGRRPEYHEHYYAAYVLDPDGRNVEAVFHGRARGGAAP